MTITYTGKVANARMFGFSRLLLYWKGSIYKLMYKEMCVFCVLYGALSLLYRLALTEAQKRVFEKVSLHCEAFINLIPLSFVLGFYVAVVVGRWWNQYLNIPWPDRCMMYVATMIEGADDRGRIIRRQLMRYLTLSSLIVFQATSVSVKKRFPTMEHLLEADVITLEEVGLLADVNTPHGKWWVVMVWACNLVKQARKEGRIADDFLMKTIMDEIQVYRGQLGNLYSYDWISVPLVYTQVTTLAVYTFFVGCIFGRQFLDPSQGYVGHDVDLYIPVFTLLQFFFYMGWLKVAEQLINPFGEDDDDFNTNWVLDRNMQVSLLTVDDLYGVVPNIDKDAYYGENPPDCLPYTKSSLSTLKGPYMGSTANLSVSNDGMKVVNPMETIVEGRALTRDNVSFHNHSFLNVHQQNSPYVISPATSPTKSRRLHNMTLNGLKSAFSNSKISIGPKVGSLERDLKLNQPLNGVGLCSRQSYLEDWLSEHGSIMSSSKSPIDGRTDSLPQTPIGDQPTPESIFQMELDDDSTGVAQKTANLDLKLHLQGLGGFVNRDLERVRQEVAAEEGIKNGGVLPSQEGSNGETVYKTREGREFTSTRVELDNTDDNSTTTRLVTDPDDIPQIVIERPSSSWNNHRSSYQPPTQPPTPTPQPKLPEKERERKRNLSSSSKNSSSCSSIPSSLESVESHQRTITSITPLLSTSESIPTLMPL